MYKFKYANYINLNITKKNSKILLCPNEADNNGEYLLNFIVSKTENDVFDFFGYQFKNEEMNMNESKQFGFNLIDNYDIEDSTKTVYRYSFTLDKDYKYYLVGIKIYEIVDYFTYIFNIPRKKYNVTYSKEYQIEKKYLIDSSDFYNTFLSVDPHIGDNYIKLKVKKGVDEDSFYLGGYANKEYDGPTDNATILDINYVDKFPGDEYDILQYYFKSYENSTYFHINIIIKKPVDYLNFTFDDKSEKKQSDDDSDGKEKSEPEGGEKSGQPDKSDSGSSVSPVVLAIIIIASVLVLLLVVYFVIRKCGFLKKNDVTSKDIESVDQIIA